jgi:hypothetical protein
VIHPRERVISDQVEKVRAILKNPVEIFQVGKDGFGETLRTQFEVNLAIMFLGCLYPLD